MSNLKQIGLALIMYSKDYDDFFPASWDGWMTWTRRLWESGYVSTPTVGKPGIFVCPSYPPKVYQNVVLTYGLWKGDGSRGAVSANPHHYHLKLSKLEQDRIILADSIGILFGGYSQIYFTHGGWGVEGPDVERGECVIHLRHSRTANVLFPDGSVRSVNASWMATHGRFNYIY